MFNLRVQEFDASKCSYVGVKAGMFSRKNYHQSNIDVLGNKEIICNNRKRAYRYYSKKFASDYPHKTEKGTEIYLFTNTPYELNRANYILYDFDTLNFGRPVALGESDYILVDGKHFNYCNFRNCNIKNIIFRRCSFSGSYFYNIHFDHVIFDSCMFSTPVLEDGKTEVESIYYAPTIFETCTFVGRFVVCDIDHSLFEKVCFTLSRFEKCSLTESAFCGCAISNVNIKDCDLSNLGICQSDIVEIYFSDERKSIVNENTFIDYKINTKRVKSKENAKTKSESKDRSYDDMCLKKAKSIRDISRLFELNNLNSHSGEYFYRSKLVEIKALRGLPKIVSVFELLLCGYGERPLFTMLTIIATTLLFGLVYMFSGIDADGYIIDYSLIGGTPAGFVKAISDYGKSLFFSVTTFSTVGYGNYVPIGLVSMIMSSLHLILGISLCALWTGCVFRKIAR